MCVQAEENFTELFNIIILEQWSKLQLFAKVFIQCWQDGRPSVGPMTAHNTAPHEEANALQLLSRTWPIGHRSSPDSSQRVPRTGMLRPCVPTASPSGLHNTLPFCRHSNGTLRWETNFMAYYGVTDTKDIFYSFKFSSLKINSFCTFYSPSRLSFQSSKDSICLPRNVYN